MDKQQEQERADARIVDLLGAIVAGERAAFGRAPEITETAFALLDFVQILARQSSFAERFKIAVACRRASLKILRLFVWH